jgi:hypothetical protein
LASRKSGIASALRPSAYTFAGRPTNLALAALHHDIDDPARGPDNFRMPLNASIPASTIDAALDLSALGIPADPTSTLKFHASLPDNLANALLQSPPEIRTRVPGGVHQDSSLRDASSRIVARACHSQSRASEGW